MRPKKNRDKLRDIRRSLNKDWLYQADKYKNDRDYLQKVHFKPYCYSDKTLCQGYWKKNSNKKVRYFKGTFQMETVIEKYLNTDGMFTRLKLEVFI